MRTDDSGPEYPTTEPLNRLALVTLIIFVACNALALLLLSWIPAAIGLLVLVTHVPLDAHLYYYDRLVRGP